MPRRAVGLAVAVAFVWPAAPATADLTSGASTVVPASMNPGVVDAFGDPYEVRSRVTAVRFHNGTLPSTAAGGLVAEARPRLKKQNGVQFSEVTGELSGVGHSPIGFEYVYGPLNANGVDQSGNPASPRFGLRGITFRLVYPKHWNRHLIIFRPAGDGGRGSGHYLYQSSTDELELLRRGYAYFVTLGGTTTPPDSNPNSTSGRFWNLAPPFWADSGAPHDDYLRAARITADWKESVIPDSTPGRVWFLGEPDPVPTPIGSRAFPSDVLMTSNDDVPTFRDHVNVAKNLVERLLGSRPTQTGFASWSRSGSLAWGTDLGRTLQFPPADIAPESLDPVKHRTLTPRTGGDFNTPYVPSSGRLIDWFVVRSGVEFAVTAEGPDGQPEGEDASVDQDYPIAAPLIYVSAEADLRDIQINGYVMASTIADALPGSKLAEKDINRWLRLYTVRGVTHQPREAWFGAWIDAVRANNPPGAFDFTGDFADAVPEEGFSLQAILNADRWAKTGHAPPLSAVDADLVSHPTQDTRRPRYPVAEACTADAVFGDIAGCLASLREDSAINDPDNSGFGPLEDFEVELLQRFASGPLRFTTQPIVPPGQAAPLGYRLFTTGPVFQRPFTTAELRARYRNHGGYVKAVTRAVDALVARKLYDRDIGELDRKAAQRSAVLR